MRHLVLGAIGIATLGTLAALAVVMGWGGARPVRAVLVYAFDPPAETDPAALQSQVVETLQRRVGRDAKVRPGEGNKVEIDVYGDDATSVSRIGRLVARPGTIEFRILANRRDVEPPRLEAALASVPESGDPSLEWRPVRDLKSLGDPGDLVLDPDGIRVLTIVPAVADRVTGNLLKQVSATTDDAGSPALGFQLTAEGAGRMGPLTRANLPAPDGFHRRLAILLDGNVTSAPALRAEIGAAGVIAGRFSKRELDDLVRTLRSGALPVPLRQVVAPE